MSDRDDDDDKTISLDDLEDMEHEKEHRDDPFYNEDDWGEFLRRSRQRSLGEAISGEGRR